MKQRWMKYGVGLDMGKDQIHACVGGWNVEEGFKVIAQRRFTNTPKGWSDLTLWVDKQVKDKQIPLRIVMEVTGVYHEGVLHYLHDKGYGVCLELSKRTKKYLESIGHKSKNDKLDGQGLCRMACEREGRLWKPASKHILVIRGLLRHRKSLIDNKVQLTNQLHALTHGALKQPLIKRSVQQLIKQLDKQIKMVEQELEKMVKQDEALAERVEKIVDSVKGLGLISVLTAVAETNGFQDFSSIKQLTSYAGYDIVENTSGKFKGKTRISKQGNAHLRSAMYMPALAVIRSKVEPFYSFYIRLLKRNGALKKKAGFSFQRKILILIYTLWKNNCRFDEKHHLILAQKLKTQHFFKTSSSDLTPELHEIDHSQREPLLTGS